MSAQLEIEDPGIRGANLRWIRAMISDRGLVNVRDAQIESIYRLCGGDRQMAFEAIASIVNGRTYEPLRAKLEAERA